MTDSEVPLDLQHQIEGLDNQDAGRSGLVVVWLAAQWTGDR